MKKYLFILFIILISKPIYSQANPEVILDKFFDTYPKNTDKAIDDAYATNKWTLDMKDAINGMKKTIRGYSEDMGKYYGYELITKQQCTERFILYTYMMRYDRQPLKVTIQLYKPNDSWMLYSLTFNTDLDEDLEKAASFYIQNPVQN